MIYGKFIFYFVFFFVSTSNMHISVEYPQQKLVCPRCLYKVLTWVQTFLHYIRLNGFTCSSSPHNGPSQEQPPVTCGPKNPDDFPMAKPLLNERLWCVSGKWFISTTYAHTLMHMHVNAYLTSSIICVYYRTLWFYIYRYLICTLMFMFIATVAVEYRWILDSCRLA